MAFFKKHIPEPFPESEPLLAYLAFHPQTPNCSPQLAALWLFWQDMLSRKTSFTLVLFQQKRLSLALSEHCHPVTFGSSEFAGVNYIVLYVINLITEASDDWDLLLKTDRLL